MPLGVDHVTPGKTITPAPIVILPLMPLGVDHNKSVVMLV